MIPKILHLSERSPSIFAALALTLMLLTSTGCNSIRDRLVDRSVPTEEESFVPATRRAPEIPTEAAPLSTPPISQDTASPTDAPISDPAQELATVEAVIEATKQAAAYATLWSMASGTPPADAAIVETPAALPTALSPEDAIKATEEYQSVCNLLTESKRFQLLPAEGQTDQTGIDVWAQHPDALLQVRHLSGGRFQSISPVLPFELALVADDSIPELQNDQIYSMRSHPIPGEPAFGTALRIDDADGLPRFLAVTHSSDPNAESRLWDGGRAGFSIKQLPTRCLQGQRDDCGYDRFPAPVEFSRGPASLVLNAGETGVLESTPAYQVTVFTSFVRLWRSSTSCETDEAWPLSYRIERVDQ